MPAETGFFASLGRELRLLAKRPWDLAMITWVPALAVALLCWILSAGVAHRLPIAVWDEDHSAMSRQIVRWLDTAPGLSVVQYVDNSNEARWALQSMGAYAVVHMPPHMARDVQQGRGANVNLLSNMQLFTHSGLIQRDVNQVVGALSAGIQMQGMAARGTPNQALEVRRQPITTHPVALFNISNNNELLLTFGLVPVLLHLLAMTAGAWSVGRELRDRSLGAWLLGSATIPKSDDVAPQPGLLATQAALVGKLVVPWASLTAISWCALFYLLFWRGWGYAGSLTVVLAGLALLMAISVLGGALIAAGTMSLRSALSMSGLISAPAFAISGVAFPLLSMTDGAYRWTIALPYTHYLRLQIEQLQVGVAAVQSLPILASLTLACLIAWLLTALALRRGAGTPSRWGQR